MTDFIVVVILAVVLGSAIRYIYKAKKRGVKCIGCPAAGSCSQNSTPSASNHCSCGCGSAKSGSICSGCCHTSDNT